jgi:formate hydrogenlyase subunit 4
MNSTSKSTSVLAFFFLTIFFFSPVLAQNNQVAPQNQFADKLAEFIANSIVWTIRTIANNFTPIFNFFIKWIWPPLAKIGQAVLSVIFPGIVSPPTV